jgi:DNA processing protein
MKPKDRGVDDRGYWLAWSQVAGIGPILIRRLQKHFGSLETAWEAHGVELVEVDGLGLVTVEGIVVARRAIEPATLLQEHEEKNPNFWTPADTDYPRLLLEIPDPPPVLYYRGRVSRSELQGLTPSIAIVGTRSPSDYGRRWTRRFTAALVQTGYTIVSGLADGIDTEAHRSCVEVQGRTIAVLGTGVNVVYPWANRDLYEQVLQDGLVVSEYPADTKPDRAHFPRRNRIIAGLSRATIVIEAPQKSGALITAYLANDYGRDVYALPGSLDNPKSIGCLSLLNKGAHVILGEDHLLEMLGTLPQLRPPQTEQTQLRLDLPPVSSNLPPELQQVLQAIADLSDRTLEAIPFDRIVQQAALPTGSVSSALLQLELSGLVTELPGMRYQRS